MPAPVHHQEDRLGGYDPNTSVRSSAPAAAAEYYARYGLAAPSQGPDWSHLHRSAVGPVRVVTRDYHRVANNELMARLHQSLPTLHEPQPDPSPTRSRAVTGTGADTRIFPSRMHAIGRDHTVGELAAEAHGYTVDTPARRKMREALATYAKFDEKLGGHKLAGRIGSFAEFMVYKEENRGERIPLSEQRNLPEEAPRGRRDAPQCPPDQPVSP